MGQSKIPETNLKSPYYVILNLTDTKRGNKNPWNYSIKFSKAIYLKVISYKKRIKHLPISKMPFLSKCFQSRNVVTEPTKYCFSWKYSRFD